jgi:hypothetical protein
MPALLRPAYHKKPKSIWIQNALCKIFSIIVIRYINISMAEEIERAAGLFL